MKLLYKLRFQTREMKIVNINLKGTTEPPPMRFRN